MPNRPTAITALPTPPSRADSANFATRGDALLEALPTFVTQTNALASVSYSNAVEAAASATLAGSLADTALDATAAVKWVSGTSYAVGAVAWSPANGKVYRRLIAGAGTTDPSADATNWVLVTGLWSVDGGGVAFTANSASTAVRITQTGAGEALRVEDSANPDSTPFVIDNAGNVNIGSASRDATGSVNGIVQVQSTSGTNSSVGLYTWSSSPSSHPYFTINKSLGAAVGTRGLVGDEQPLGIIYWAGDDGSSFVRAAAISSVVDAPPGLNDMPGRLVFSTTSVGAAGPAERMRLTSLGNVAVGASTGTSLSSVRLTVDRIANSPQPPSFTSGTAALFIGSTAATSPCYITLVSGNAAPAAILFGDTDADSRGRVYYDHATDAMALWTSNSEKLRISSAGDVTVSSGSLSITSATGTLGYGTGSGGSVTQATSRTTGVTLNKATGAITLFSTTTTAGQVTTFTVTNSTVAATDTIVVNQKTGGGVYLCSVTAVTAGTFNISVHTPAAVGVAEAPTLNFAVIKGVVA